MSVVTLIEILHQRFKQPYIDFELFECLGKMHNFIDILQLHNPLSDKLILLIALLYVFEILPDIILLDRLVHGFGLEALLERVLNAGMFGLDFLLHIFGDGVFEGGELHINFDHIFVGQTHNFLVYKLLG